MNIFKLAHEYYKQCLADTYRPANVKTKVRDLLDDRDRLVVSTIDVRCVTGDKDICYVDIYLNQTPSAELRLDSIKNKVPTITSVLNAMWKNVTFIVKCQ